MNKKLIIIFFLFTHFINGQEKKNTIRYNISNPVIFGIENVIIGYERIVGNNQTFSVDFGVNQLPSLRPRSFTTENARLSINNSKKNSGVHFSFDYRFYLKSENKFQAPRGIYIGPYYSFNSFKKSNDWTLNSLNFNGNVDTDLQLDIHTLGVEMGYQFIISDRFAIDIIFLGPGIGRYKIDVSLNSSLNVNDREFILENLNDLIAKKIPGYNIVVNSENFKTNGKVDVNTLGYRFMINLGYRF